MSVKIEKNDVVGIFFWQIEDFRQHGTRAEVTGTSDFDWKIQTLNHLQISTKQNCYFYVQFYIILSDLCNWHFFKYRPIPFLAAHHVK